MSPSWPHSAWSSLMSLLASARMLDRSRRSHPTGTSRPVRPHADRHIVLILTISIIIVVIMVRRIVLCNPFIFIFLLFFFLVVFFLLLQMADRTISTIR
ncbi:hypothetical protein F5H01DRAFT_336041 [Linnemannia elongata]|nr:hypothetical protein F5H01DRAFT_336041 [Linnemannia elongata]